MYFHITYILQCFSLNPVRTCYFDVICSHRRRSEAQASLKLSCLSYIALMDVLLSFFVIPSLQLGCLVSRQELGYICGSLALTILCDGNEYASRLGIKSVLRTLCWLLPSWSPIM